MSIKLLAKDVINQISAGEVVEKPASVVKELVENSIDAGASNIVIEIKNGGISYISVQDDGSGILCDEICLAFTPHATSKISNIDDLQELCSMGFRGEALATISAVSDVYLSTKTQNDEIGTKVYLQGGELIDSQSIACVVGTKIEVLNLFYNTPARLKFLRKPKSEESDITTYVQKLIMSRSDISFKYIIDGKIIYNTLSGNLKDNIYSIYGKEFCDNLLEVNYSLDDYKIYGYISKPEYTKANRTYQTLFVNKRFCGNATISSAVSLAYENFLMKGKFPVYILFLELPQNQLDVNVHPNKLEVKFSENSKVFKLVNDGVFKSLSDNNNIQEIIEKEPINNFTDNILIEKNEGISYKNQDNNAEQDLINIHQKTDQDDSLLKDYLKNFEELTNNDGSYKLNLHKGILQEINLKSENKNDEITEIKKENTNQLKTENIFENNYKTIGKVFNTYLILEQDEKLFLIDQHAAHERYNYDKLMEQIKTNNLAIQNLLIPYTLKVNAQEASFLSSHLEDLIQMGIMINELGYNTFGINGVPTIISDINLNEFFEGILSDLNSVIKEPHQVIKEKFMQKACKSSVKGGDDLHDSEIKQLLLLLKNDIKLLQCPHGRPIVVQLDKKQIEKWFKRIV